MKIEMGIHIIEKVAINVLLRKFSLEPELIVGRTSYRMPLDFRVDLTEVVAAADVGGGGGACEATLKTNCT